MKIQLIDSHCHLYVDAFKQDIHEVIERAVYEGVEQFILPAIDSSEIQNLLNLEKAWPENCFAMMGLHPCSVNENHLEELQIVKDWLARRNFVAIGEIGLDYYWDKTFVKEQQAAFHKQIEWALKYDRPIVIHSRNSTEDCISIVKEHQDGNLSGIFHCFSGDTDAAEKIIDLGFHMGIGGVLTYKNSGLAEVVKNIPLQHLVLETDAPYLAPVPFRGKRNESSYILYIAAKLAELKNITIEEVAAVTTSNAKKIFRELEVKK
ncbi:MAG: TatD family hydrolase [Chitinophagaceae bacterium]